MALVFFNIWELKLSSSSVHVCYQTLEPDTYNECLLVQPRFETTILVSSRGHFSGFSLFKIFTRLHETEAKPIFSFFTNYFFQIVFSFENSMYKGSRPRFCCKWHQCGLTYNMIVRLSDVSSISCKKQEKCIFCTKFYSLTTI